MTKADLILEKIKVLEDRLEKLTEGRMSEKGDLDDIYKEWAREVKQMRSLFRKHYREIIAALDGEGFTYSKKKVKVVMFKFANKNEDIDLCGKVVLSINPNKVSEEETEKVLDIVRDTLGDSLGSIDKIDYKGDSLDSSVFIDTYSVSFTDLEELAMEYDYNIGDLYKFDPNIDPYL